MNIIVKAMKKIFRKRLAKYVPCAYSFLEAELWTGKDACKTRRKAN